MSTIAITIKGIARSLTKLGVQDGQSEDIVNLRLKDGSWRATDDGKRVYTMNVQYKDLYVHTNGTYHHLLGVRDNKLYWFANIGSNGEDFDPIVPVEICEAIGDITIVQNGHLLTILDNGKVTYSIFIVGRNDYKLVSANANGISNDRELFPYGRVHLNLDSDYNADRDFVDEDAASGIIVMDKSDINYQDSGALVPKSDELITRAAAQVWHASMLRAFNKAQEANCFTRPFLAIVAVRLYDGSYAFASNPMLLNPREKYSSYKQYYDIASKTDKTSSHLYYVRQGATLRDDLNGLYYLVDVEDKLYIDSFAAINATPYMPNYYSGARGVGHYDPITFDTTTTEYIYLSSAVVGSQLLLTLGDISNILNNEEVFSGISIFMTPEINLYNMSEDGYKKGEVKCFSDKKTVKSGLHEYSTTVGNVTYKPEVRSEEDVEYELIHSPFFLLRDYSINELKSMSNTTIAVDLSDPIFKGRLKNITNQRTLPSEAVDRRSFCPSVIYNYNNRLHIANYESEQFHGYPIDFFQLSNHNLKIKKNSYAIGGVLPNVVEGMEFQYGRNKYFFAQNEFIGTAETDKVSQYINKANSDGTCFAYIAVTIDSQQGESKVVRYIKPYNSNSVGSALGQSPFAYGDSPNFVEDLSALLIYPDSRAKKMDIELVYLANETSVLVWSKSFTLSPHAYLNFAYYINSNLRPISISTQFSPKQIPFGSDDFKKYCIAPKESNIKESHPNGLKVSLSNNPFVFPYETTYQIGSAEIVSLMSNAVAVGTGQTGAAPLYVFCKDGVYALMVDSSGEMVYTNARIIARDVCNNGKSVTPIDDGVVFTTNRGLMNISGNEVVEIGHIAEGEVFDISDTNDVAQKLLFNAFTMHQLSGLPVTMIDKTDFLSYLNESIINYNHNERELIISNPSKEYSYVMDREGNWSRRNYSAIEYVNNYPTSYRLDNLGSLYKVDAEDSISSSFYLLSNIIKLGSVAYKQVMTMIVRGNFETDTMLGLYVLGSYDGNQWSVLGGNEKSGKFTDIGCKVSHVAVKYLRICIAGNISHQSRIDFVEVEYKESNLNTKLR